MFALQQVLFKYKVTVLSLSYNAQYLTCQELCSWYGSVGKRSSVIPRSCVLLQWSPAMCSKLVRQHEARRTWRVTSGVFRISGSWLGRLSCATEISMDEQFLWANKKPTPWYRVFARIIHVPVAIKSSGAISLNSADRPRGFCSIHSPWKFQRVHIPTI